MSAPKKKPAAPQPKPKKKAPAPPVLAEVTRAGSEVLLALVLFATLVQEKSPVGSVLWTAARDILDGVRDANSEARS